MENVWRGKEKEQNLPRGTFLTRAKPAFCTCSIFKGKIFYAALFSRKNQRDFSFFFLKRFAFSYIMHDTFMAAVNFYTNKRFETKKYKILLST